MTVPATVDPGPPAARARPAGPPHVTAAVAVDLGSARTRVWVAGRGTLSCATGDTPATAGKLVRRGRVADGAGCIALLSELVGKYREPVPAGPVVVACRPVLATMAEQEAVRRVLTEVLAPSRVTFIDTVRAAAIGAGAAAGPLLIADIGVALTEVAVLEHGRVRAARRAEVGTGDLDHGSAPDVVAHATVRMVEELRQDAAARPLMAAARHRGLVLAGDGAMRPELTLEIAGGIRIPVRCAASPWTAALSGAGLAALAVARHPATA